MSLGKGTSASSGTALRDRKGAGHTPKRQNGAVAGHRQNAVSGLTALGGVTGPSAVALAGRAKRHGAAKILGFEEDRKSW